jgi:hypothetical protein
MVAFAVWLKGQKDSDPELKELKDYAQTNAASWPYQSDDLNDYLSVMPATPDPKREALLLALGSAFGRWKSEQSSQKRGIWSSLIDMFLENAGVAFLAIFGVLIALILCWGLFFDTRFLTSLAKPEQARGLLTFLFAFSAIAIMLLIAITTFWMEKDELESRFGKAKDLLTIIIGVLGTIFGFYFGSLNTGDGARAMLVANVGLSSYIAAPGDKVTISATIIGGSSPYQYSIIFRDATGAVNTDSMNIKDRKSETAGISEEIAVPTEIKNGNAVIFTIVTKDAKGTQAQSVGTLFIKPKSAT